MSRFFSIEVAKDYFNFASAHFLIFPDGQREPLHGHNYQVSVTLEGEIDHAGVVLDFITFKPLVKQVCDALDHRTLIQTESPVIKVNRRGKEIEVRYKTQRLITAATRRDSPSACQHQHRVVGGTRCQSDPARVRKKFPHARIRNMEVGVEEARGQRGIFRGEF